MNEKYEVTGPIQRIEQRKPSVAGLEHLPNFDSFDLEFSPTGKVIRKTSYTGAGTVQSYERFLYDDGDKLIERCWFDGELTGKQHAVQIRRCRKTCELDWLRQVRRRDSNRYTKIYRRATRICRKHRG